MHKKLLIFIVSVFVFFLSGEAAYAFPLSLGKEGGDQIKFNGSEAADAPGEFSVLIDTTRCTLTIFLDGQAFATYPVALGHYDTPTPLGDFQIVRKAMHWGSGFGSRWLELNVPWGTYGIHGTNKPYSIGSYASHGCIRLHNKDIEEFYPLVKAGTPVVIVGNPFLYRHPPYRVLRRDFCGSDVMEVQRLLARLGLFVGEIDGTWRWNMEESVCRFREKYGLPPDNAVDKAVYKALGLY